MVPSDLCEFETTPSGLLNAPAKFHRLINHIPRYLIPKCCLVYMDGVIIHAATSSEHSERLMAVSKRLRDAGSN